ncbi:DUF5009 domain-containing protein [Fulvivirga sp. M361]|nr:DUF5009 domain-containing protein [Fulvivirga sp. M361]
MILVNTPGSWNYVYPPLLHASWNGITPTDCVFPFFIFIMGVSISLSLQKYRTDDVDVPGKLYKKIVQRALILFFIGLFLNAFPYFNLTSLRIPGVLQRIAIVFLVCSVLYLKFSHRTILWTMTGLLLGYWLIVDYVPVPEGHDHLQGWLDHTLLRGHLWSQTKVWDPEGVLSTLPAVASGIAGLVFGYSFVAGEKTGLQYYLWLGIGLTGIVIGLVWDLIFPINKSLWTSSFVLFTSGTAILFYMMLHWVLDKKSIFKIYFQPFVHMGSNAIAAYTLSIILVKLLFLIPVEGVSSYGWIFNHLFLPWLDPYMASLAFALGFLAINYLILLAMYKKSIFIKI